MALYTTFGEIQSMVRAESRLSTNPAVNASANERIKQIINRVYHWLAEKHDWEHLNYVAPRFPLAAGQTDYDIPAGIDQNRMIEVVLWWGNLPYPLDPDISIREKAAYNATNRVDPAQRFMLVSNEAGSTQIRIWPTPASNSGEIEIRGTRATPKLVNSADICLLDDMLVTLFASEAMLRPINKDDADGKLAAANEMLRTLRSNSVLPQTGGRAMPRMGLEKNVATIADGKIIVRVGR